MLYKHVFVTSELLFTFINSESFDTTLQFSIRNIRQKKSNKESEASIRKYLLLKSLSGVPYVVGSVLYLLTCWRT